MKTNSSFRLDLGHGACLTTAIWRYRKPLNQGTSYQIRKIVGCACAGNAGNVFPATDFKRKTLVSDPGMHHVTCVTHVPWCMSGSLTHGGGENVPGIPGACATRNFTYLARGPWHHSFQMKAALSLTNRLATASDRSTETGPCFVSVVEIE